MNHKYISIAAVTVAVVASSLLVQQAIAKDDNRDRNLPYYERFKTVEVMQSVDFSVADEIVASCDKGDTVVLGGYAVDPNGISTTHIVSSRSVFANNLPTGWRVLVQTQEPTVSVTVSAICQKGKR